MNKRYKKALYESIMTQVARTVKRALNESIDLNTIFLKDADTITAEEKELIKAAYPFKKNSYKVKNKKELENIINICMEVFGNRFDLNWVDVSNVTDMRHLFYGSDFDGDISQWDVSNVTDMSYMFDSCRFNGDISQWDVSNVTNMSRMFAYSRFNGHISYWDVSNVTDMDGMFMGSEFGGDISQWDTHHVRTMRNIFKRSRLEQERKAPIWF